MIPDHPIVRHLWIHEPAAPPEVRFESAARAYEEAHQFTLARPLSVESRQVIAEWLEAEEFNAPVDENGHGVPLLVRTWPRSFDVVGTSLASRVVKLGQRHCRDCLLNEDVTPLSVSFAIRVRPFSAQSLKADRLSKLKSAIKDYLHARDTFQLKEWHGGEVCVSVVAVVPESARRMDVDNMAKGLLDAMQGTLYSNDRDIQHLDMRRVVHSGELSYYSIFAQPVRDQRVGVLDERLNLSLLSTSIEVDL